MGLFDIFKGIKKKETEPETQELSVSEAKHLLQERAKEAQTKLADFTKQIQAKVATFQDSLSEEIISLQGIDISEKKEDERLKRLTLQGLEEYIEQLRRLSKNLSRVDFTTSAHKYIHQIDEALNSFSKGSFKKYHRATILIGKELAKINNTVQTFHREIHELATEHEAPVSHVRAFGQTQEHESSLKEISNSLQTVQEILDELTAKHKEAMQAVTQHQEEYTAAKKGEEYTAIKQEKEAIQKDRLQVAREISMLQGKLDLKEISKRVHGYTKHKEIVAKYRNNFSAALHEDTNLEFIEALNETEQGLVADALRTARDKSITLEEKERTLDPGSVLRPIESAIKEKEASAQELLDQITLEEKKKTKFEESKNELQTNIQNLLTSTLPNVKLLG